MGVCWLKDKLAPSECPSIDPEKEASLLSDKALRLKKKCSSCIKFVVDLSSVNGVDTQIYKETMPVAFGNEMRERIEQLEEKLSSIYRSTKVLKETTNLEEVISITLSLLTSKEGFGFERAIFLKYEPDRKGFVPVAVHSAGVRGSLSDMFISVDMDHPVLKAFFERRCAVFDRKNQKKIYELMVILGVDSFGLIPLWGSNRPLGIIIVDNPISMKHVDPASLKALEGLAGQLSLAVEKAMLYEDLKCKLKELEETKRQIEKQQNIILNMEKALAVVDVTSKIVHEIRNPLTVIGGIANMLLKKREFDEEALKKISDEAKRIDMILKDLSSYNEASHPKKIKADLVYVVKEAIREFRRNSKAEVVYKLPKAPVEVQIDPLHIKKMIKAILYNAFEAQSKKGIDAPIKLEMEVYSDEVVITVIDRGGGVSDEVKTKMFEPFFTTKKDGTGLGLSVVLMVLSEHGGNIEVENTKDGLCVTVKLPLKEVQYAQNLNS